MMGCWERKWVLGWVRLSGRVSREKSHLSCWLCCPGLQGMRTSRIHCSPLNMCSQIRSPGVKALDCIIRGTLWNRMMDLFCMRTLYKTYIYNETSRIHVVLKMYTPDAFWNGIFFLSKFLSYHTKFELESQFEFKLGNYALQVRTMNLFCMRSSYKNVFHF